MKVFYTIFISILLSFNILYAEFEFAGDIKSHKVFDNRIEFTLSNCLFNIYPVDKNIIRFRYVNQNAFSNAPSYAVIYEQKNKMDFTLNESESEFTLNSGELVVKIQKSPCRVSIYDTNGNILNEDEKSFGVSFDCAEVRCFKKLYNDESFYGLGEKTGQLNKRGGQFTMWNTDFPAYASNIDPIYQSIPFFIGIRNKKAYGIFFDNTYKSFFNMGASNNRFYWFGAQKGEMDYYFIYGPEVKKVISSYTLLTGKMEMPPLWALGYQQSKWSYYPESTVHTLAKNFRDKQIPCDVIYLDIHYMNGYRVFTWDNERFPNPEKMLTDLRNDGFKVVPIIDPGVKADTNYFAAKEGLAKNLFAKYPDGINYQGEVWPSWAFFPDFTKTETRDWWGEKLSALLKQGIEGFWNDMNEPAVWGQSFPDIVQFDDHGFKADHKKIHNVYALSMAQATFDGLRKHDPDKRHFLLTRAGYAGIQRYSAVWTGDNVANEEHLRLAAVMPMGMGLSGIPFTGSDVGGFVGVPSSSLYIRWMQLGAFTPFFRGHSAIGNNDKEPWAFGESTEFIVKEIINMRYRFLPFLYNEFYNASQTGLPIIRPMFVDFQNDKECYKGEAEYQFMVGENLLVAPVLNSFDHFKKLYLPEGKWIDMRNKKVYDGQQWIIVEAPLNEIPVFIREGGIIPTQEIQQYVGEKKITETVLHIFPSNKSSYTFYEDDGVTYQFKNGNYSLTRFDLSKSGNSAELNISKQHSGYKSSRENYLIKIYSDKPNEVKVNGKSISQLDSEKKVKGEQEGFYYDTDNNLLIIKVKDSNKILVRIN